MEEVLLEQPLHGDILCSTTVTLQDDNYKAFLLLRTERIEMIALKLDQTDRVRNYTWRYNQIKKVVKAEILDRSLFYLYLNDQSEICDSFEVIFSSRGERDAYADRITRLIKLFTHNPKRIESRRQETSQSSPPRKEVNRLSNDVGLNMFSPENLKRLSAVSSQELISNNLEIIDTSSIPGGPTFDARAFIDDGNNIFVPVEIDLPGLDNSIVASAKLRLRLRVDKKALRMTDKFEDRSERLSKIRDLVEIDVDVCELVFR